MASPIAELPPGLRVLRFGAELLAVELGTPACQNGGMSADDSVPADTIATLRIDLLGSDPPIWRELEVPIAMTLKQLHAVVQAAMGWENAHLWEFAVGGERIGSSRATKLTLQALLQPRTTKLTYIYDFGDCWEHQLILTRPRAADPSLGYPRYLAGEHAAPPEDCGGIPGFYSQLEILADPKHPDHPHIKDWFGDYDPNGFDEQPIKDRLARITSRRARSPAGRRNRAT